MKLQIKHTPLLAFLLFFLKSLILGVNWQEVGFGLVLGLIAYLYEHKSNDKKIEQVLGLLGQSEEAVRKLEAHLESRLASQDLVVNENRSYISSMKLQRNGGSNGLGR